jgi:hypothetical protein
MRSSIYVPELKKCLESLHYLSLHVHNADRVRFITHNKMFRILRQYMNTVDRNFTAIQQLERGSTFGRF